MTERAEAFAGDTDNDLPGNFQALIRRLMVYSRDLDQQVKELDQEILQRSRHDAGNQRL